MNVVLPNEWDIEFALDTLPDGRIKVTCMYCVSQGKTKGVAWACLNHYFATEAMKYHRQEHFAISLDSSG